MTITPLDQTPALIVVDLQKGIAGLPSIHPMEQVVGNSARLAAAFRERGLPVVLVNVTGGAPGRNEGPARSSSFPADFAELLPELDRQPTDVLISKQRWGAFTGTALHEKLQELGVTQVVLTGVSTHIGVESTARSAAELGYNVVLVTDAMTTNDADAHVNSIERIFPRLGERGTTQDVLDLLPKA